MEIPNLFGCWYFRWQRASTRTCKLSVKNAKCKQECIYSIYISYRFYTCQTWNMFSTNISPSPIVNPRGNDVSYLTVTSMKMPSRCNWSRHLFVGNTGNSEIHSFEANQQKTEQNGIIFPSTVVVQNYLPKYRRSTELSTQGAVPGVTVKAVSQTVLAPLL